MTLNFTVDRRAVSVTVGYILMLAVAMLLMGVLLSGAGGLMESQSKQVIDDELTVIGNQLASNIHEADRLAVVGAADTDTAGGEPTIDLTVRLPRQVAGTGYLVDIGNETITLSTSNPDIEVTVSYPEPETDLEKRQVSGGDLRIDYDSGQLVINS